MNDQYVANIMSENDAFQCAKNLKNLNEDITSIKILVLDTRNRYFMKAINLMLNFLTNHILLLDYKIIKHNQNFSHLNSSLNSIKCFGNGINSMCYFPNKVHKILIYDELNAKTMTKITFNVKIFIIFGQNKKTHMDVFNKINKKSDGYQYSLSKLSDERIIKIDIRKI